VPTNNPLFAVLKDRQRSAAHELVMGASNKYTADEQIEQVAFYWINLHSGHPIPADGVDHEPRPRHDAGHRRRQSHPEDQRAASATVSEPRAAGVVIDRVLLVHDGTQPRAICSRAC
jgi:hypothetical protein